MNNVPENLQEQLAYEAVRHFEGTPEYLVDDSTGKMDEFENMGAFLAEAAAYDEIDLPRQLQQLDVNPSVQAWCLGEAFKRVESGGADRLRLAVERLDPGSFDLESRIYLLANAQQAAMEHGVQPPWLGFRVDPVAVLEEFAGNEATDRVSMEALYACDMYYPWDDPNAEPTQKLLDATLQFLDSEAAQQPNLLVAVDDEMSGSTEGEFVSLSALKGFHRAGRVRERDLLVDSLLQRLQFGSALTDFVGSLYEQDDPEADALYQVISVRKQDLPFSSKMDMKRVDQLVSRGEFGEAMVIAEGTHSYKNRVSTMTNVALARGRAGDLAAAKSLLEEVVTLDPRAVELASDLDLEHDADADCDIVSLFSGYDAKISAANSDRDNSVLIKNAAEAAAELGFYPIAVRMHVAIGQKGHATALSWGSHKTMANFAAERQETTAYVDAILSNEELEAPDRLELLKFSLEFFNRQRALGGMPELTAEQYDMLQKTADLAEQAASETTIMNDDWQEIHDHARSVLVESGRLNDSVQPENIDKNEFDRKTEHIGRFIIYLARAGQTEEALSVHDDYRLRYLALNQSVIDELLEVGLAQNDNALLRRAAERLRTYELADRLAVTSQKLGRDLPPAPEWLIDESFGQGHRDLKLVRKALDPDYESYLF
jgi:hypothetical protein